MTEVPLARHFTDWDDPPATSRKRSRWRTAERTGALNLERFRLELMALRGELLADKQLGEALLKAYDEGLANRKTAE